MYGINYIRMRKFYSKQTFFFLITYVHPDFQKLSSFSILIILTLEQLFHMSTFYVLPFYELLIINYSKLHNITHDVDHIFDLKTILIFSRTYEIVAIKCNFFFLMYNRSFLNHCFFKKRDNQIIHTLCTQICF